MDTFQYLNCLRYASNPEQSIHQLRCSEWLVRRFKIDKRLQHHQGCVNTVCWAEQSPWTHLLSAGDDRCLILNDVETGEQLTRVETSHADNIFCVRFLYKSSDCRVVSCSSDGMVILTDLNRPQETNVFNCCVGRGPVYELRPFPNCPNVFLACSEDGTVRLYDLRMATSCATPNSGIRNRPLRSSHCPKHVFIDCQISVNSMDICPTRHHELAVGCSDGVVRLYDMRKTKRPFATSRPSLPVSNSRRITKCMPRKVTCTKYHERGDELLVSFSAGDICLYLPRYMQQSNRYCLHSATSTTESDEAAGSGANGPPARFPKRLRIRGDWSDTGPDSRPIRETSGGDAVDRLANVMYQLLLPDEEPQRRSSERFDPSISEQVLHNRDDRVVRRLVDDITTRISNQNDNFESSDSSSEGDSWMFRILASTFAVENTTPDEDLDSSDNPSSSVQPSPTDILLRGITNRRQRRERQFVRRGYRSDQTCGLSSFAGTGSLGFSDPISKRHVAEIVDVRRFSGHRNVRTVIKECAFWGDNHVMSGSDCGHIFVWNKNNGKIVAIYEGDSRVVNCIQPHPEQDRFMFASSGISHDVKVWYVDGKSSQDPSKISRIVNINRVMTDEAQNTVTVPAPIIFRLLTTFSRSRILRTLDSSLED
ncbi:hypothetical protein ACOME3_010177 [Neoechinorhynchus agilis]